MSIDYVISSLTNPTKLCSRSEVLGRLCPVPERGGLYAWYFKNIPPRVPIYSCKMKDSKILLYVGISPRNATSSGNLRKRVTTHYRDDAEWSTLRFSLGALLTPLSNFPLRLNDSNGSKTFAPEGERWLDLWMEENAFVCWVRYKEPWKIEKELFKKLSLPLNIDDNKHHPFATKLEKIRDCSKQIAKLIPRVPAKKK